ncbi:MAG: endolytic transglycosylase MltG [Burkholderiaceae bacterium]
MQRLFVLLGLLVLVIAGASVWSHYQYAGSLLEFDRLPVKVTIPKGTGVRGAATALQQGGIRVPSRLFRVAARMRGDAERLKAGTYRFTEAMTLKQIIDRLVAGDVALEEIRFIEGWTFAQIREALDKSQELKHDSTGMTEKELLDKLGIDAPRAEGQFFPSTYHFTDGTSDLEILKQAHRQLQKRSMQRGSDARRIHP